MRHACREILEDVQQRIETQMILASTLESFRRRERLEVSQIAQLEYRVFSQFGDDGIIAYLASKIPPTHHSFIEFGVENYAESNTRLLLQRDNWRGLILDGSEANISQIKTQPYFWKHDLQAVQAFITTENVNKLFLDSGFNGETGILSIDIDGVDYWIWNAISCIQPLVVVCEYNSLFAAESTVTVPYDPTFVRGDKHSSNLYAGASLGALVYLARQRDMKFLGCNSAGNNAYFVHESLNIDLPFPSVQNGFVRSCFREARDESGTLLMKTAHECRHMISNLPVIDVVTNEQKSVGDAVEK